MFPWWWSKPVSLSVSFNSTGRAIMSLSCQWINNGGFLFGKTRSWIVGKSAQIQAAIKEVPMRWNLKRYGVAVMAGLAMCIWQGTVLAQGYPSRPIKMIVPYAAGGFTDQVSRVLAESMSKTLGQPIVIDSRAGGGGRIGAEAVTKMSPEGYDLLMTTNGTHTFMAVTEKNLSYDPITDFTPVSLVGSYGLLMVVNPSLPVKTLPEFIKYAKENPGKLNYATSGMGSGLHFAGELFKSMAKVDMTHVPYKGSGPGMQDVISGICQVIFDGGAKPFVDSGKVRLLGTTSAKRDPRYPQMPTLGEGGLPGYDLTYWVGLFGPKGMSKEVQMKLNAAIKVAVADPQVQTKLSAMGLVLVGSSPEELVKEIKTETDKLRAIAASIPGGVQ
jgi:tripartite-type tricarboxylate transporter receptor subunit TctC